MSDEEFRKYIATLRAKGGKIPKKRIEFIVKGRKQPFRIFLSDKIEHLNFVIDK